jgi:hypothetical protein
VDLDLPAPAPVPVGAGGPVITEAQAVLSVRLTRVEMGVLAGVLDQHLALYVDEGADGQAEPDDGLQDLAAVVQALASTLERPATASRATLSLTPAAARQVRVVVEQHYDTHRHTANGTQVALGRRLERLVRTLRSEALAATPA